MICKVCGVDKPKVDFPKSHKDCKLCHNERTTIIYRRLRGLVLFHYSGNPPKCACCGESNSDFLTMNHIIPVRRQGRHDLNWSGGHRLIRELIRLKFPVGFNVLCYNCNCASGFSPDGICPHELRRHE